MTEKEGSWLVWLARVAGLGVTAFFALFALDALNEGSVAHRLLATAIHLGPAALCLGVVLLGWRRWWVGALGFAALATGYVAMAGSRPDWLAVIAGPLALTSLLFVVAGLARRRPAA